MVITQDFGSCYIGSIPIGTTSRLNAYINNYKLFTTVSNNYGLIPNLHTVVK